MTPFWIGFTWMLIWVAISGSTLLVPKRWAPLCVLLATVWMFMGVLKAEDARPTVEQLQAQIAQQNQQIQYLQRQLVLAQREAALHQQAFMSCLDQSEQQQAQQQQKRPEAKQKP